MCNTAGATITVTGTNYYGAAAANSITFTGSNPPTCGTVTITGFPTTISCTLTPGTGLGPFVVQVNSNGGTRLTTANTITYAGVPTIATNGLTLTGCTGSGTTNTLTNCPIAAAASLVITGTNYFGTNAGNSITLTGATPPTCGTATITGFKVLLLVL